VGVLYSECPNGFALGFNLIFDKEGVDWLKGLAFGLRGEVFRESVSFRDSSLAVFVYFDMSMTVLIWPFLILRGRDDEERRFTHQRCELHPISQQQHIDDERSI